MTFMLRALVLAMLVFVLPCAASGQALSVLRIKVVLVDAEGKPAPVPRHALLVSDNPASAAPRLVRTGLDGTVDVRLRPGSYTVESDRPVTLQRDAYYWTQTVNIVAGQDAVLELTADNAEVEPSTASASGATPDADPWLLLPRWRDSVVAIWTPTTHASGFLIDASGLIATNQRVIGTATSVEVQLTPSIKVAASVLAADPGRDVAVLRVDPKVIASLPLVSLSCAQAATPAVVEQQEIFTVGVSLRQVKDMASGTVRRVDLHDIMWNGTLPAGSAGGPVFTAHGDLVGITSVLDEKDQRGRGDSRIVPVQDACDVVASAQKKMATAAPPAGTHLPVEPEQRFPADALRAAAESRAGSLNPYRISSADFDVAFITPVMTYGAVHQSEQARKRDRDRTTRASLEEQPLVRPHMDFSNWSAYLADFPPLLLVRLTPKLVEGFWKTVARGAARTQGISIPPIKSFKSRFGRLRAFCGDVEVNPIHPLKLELRTSESEMLYEGLYVFDPGALGPHCSSVRLLLYTEKEPDKADTRVVDPTIVQQIWQDFEPFRAQPAARQPTRQQ
jgi:hypothetical protein